MRKQPDDRIHAEDLGMLTLNDKRYVVNLQKGVPFNACIEEFDENLRCWASHHWLDDEAALIVYTYADQTEQGTFVWKDMVMQGAPACIKGGWELFNVTYGKKD